MLLENVPGFLTSGGGADFETALLALNELGYVCDAFLQDARAFVPQSRVRLFVVAAQGIVAESVRGLTPSSVRPESLVDFVLSHPNIKWSIRPLPDAQPTRKTLQSILEDLPDDHPAWWNRDRAEYFMNQLSPKHLDIAQQMIAAPTLLIRNRFPTSSQRTIDGGTSSRRHRRMSADSPWRERQTDSL